VGLLHGEGSERDQYRREQTNPIAIEATPDQVHQENRSQVG
jgi:hypothetical protein